MQSRGPVCDVLGHSRPGDSDCAVIRRPYRTAPLLPYRCPQGWDDWDALVEPYVYMYTRPAFSYNCQPFRVRQ